MFKPRLDFAVVFWLAILSVVASRLALSEKRNSVYPIFSEAGKRWSESEPLYIAWTQNLDQFRYLPVVASFFSIFASVPERAGATIWLLLNASLFLGAFFVWWKRRESMDRVGLALLLIIPISLGSLNNGQCNPLIAGLSLLAILSFQDQRWWLACVSLAASVFFKLYPVSLALLLGLIQPKKVSWRFAILLAFGLGWPYFVRPAEYVTSQYSEFVARISKNDRSVMPLSLCYRDFQMLTRIAGWPIDQKSYQALEAITALGCAGLIIRGIRKGWSNRKLAETAGALAACWMTLFGPATESSTYILLAPWLVKAILEVPASLTWRTALAWASYVLLVVSMAAAWFPAPTRIAINSTGIQPLAALLISIYFVVECWKSEGQASGVETPTQSLAKAA